MKRLISKKTVLRVLLSLLFSSCPNSLSLLSGHESFAAGGAVPAPPSSPSRPSVSPNSSVFSAGKIWNGTFIRHVFVIDNSGALDLEIRDIIEGDGVRAARYTRKIPAGEKERLFWKSPHAGLKGISGKPPGCCLPSRKGRLWTLSSQERSPPVWYCPLTL